MSIRRVLVTLATALASPAAWSCSCDEIQEFLPEYGATEVPTTARIYLTDRVGKRSPSLLLVATDTGAEVPHLEEVHVQGSDLIRTLIPEVELEPYTAYSVYEIRENPEAWFLTDFTTGEGADTVAPKGGKILSGVTAKDHSVLSSCGADVFLDIEVSRSEGDLYEIEAARESGDVETYIFLRKNRIILGHGTCFDNMPDLKARENITLRSRVLDVSGNASPWSNPIESHRAGCSCSTGNRGLTMAWLPLFALLGIRRRP